MLGDLDFTEVKDWDPRDHPRNPDNGQFVERLFGRTRMDPVSTGIFQTVREGFHKRPNATATDFRGLPQKHRNRMYAVWQRDRKKTGTKTESYPGIVRNVRALWDESDAGERNEGRLWYRRAKQAAITSGNKHGIDRDTAIAVTAAVSPQQEWGGNIAMADHLMMVHATDPVFDPSEEELSRLLDPPQVKNSANKWVTPPTYPIEQFIGKRFSEVTDPELAAVVFNSIMRDDGRTADIPGHEALKKDGTPKKVSPSGGFPPLASAISILRGAPEDDILNGHKVRSFYNNISDPENLLGGDDVTIDTHAVQAALDVLHLPPGGGERIKSEHKVQKAAAAALLAGTPKDKDLNMEGLYAMFASAYRDVARDLGIPPNQLQATVWLHWRNKKAAQRAERDAA